MADDLVATYYDSCSYFFDEADLSIRRSFDFEVIVTFSHCAIGHGHSRVDVDAPIPSVSHVKSRVEAIRRGHWRLVHVENFKGLKQTSVRTSKGEETLNLFNAEQLDRPFIFAHLDQVLALIRECDCLEHMVASV